MDLQPDRLFRNKLLSYAIPPPAQVWERIEKTRIGRNKRYYFLIAASILLLVFAGLMVIDTGDRQPIQNVPISPELQQITMEEPERKPVVQTPGASNEVTIVESSFPTSPKVATPRNNSPQREIETIPHDNGDNDQLSATEPQRPIDSMIGTQNIAQKLPTEVFEETGPKRNQVIIVYSRDEANDKFLRKTIHADTQVERVHDIWQNLPDIALGIKYGGHGIGDLRQFKDDLLSLEFLAKNNSQSKADKK